MSNLVNGFKNYKSVSNIFHKFASFLKDNGECTLGGNKLLERFCKIEGSKDRRTLESMFPVELTDSDPILDALIEHYVLSFKLWKKGSLWEYESFFQFCKSAHNRKEIPELEDGDLYIPNAAEDHPLPHYQTDFDLLADSGEYFNFYDFSIEDAYKLQYMIDGQALGNTFNEMRIGSVGNFNCVSTSVVNEYLREEIRDQTNKIILNIVLILSTSNTFDDSTENLNKIIKNVVKNNFKY